MRKALLWLWALGALIPIACLAADAATESGGQLAVVVGAVNAPESPEADTAADADAAAPDASATCSVCGGPLDDPASSCDEPCGAEDSDLLCGLEFFGPLPMVNQHPPALLFLNPQPDVATTLAEGRRSLSARLEFANNIIRELDRGVITDFDFETLRPSINYAVGLPGGEFSASLPLIYRSHGALDGLIADWHGWFGLLNGWRDTFPDNGFRYIIASREGLVFDDQGDSFGLSDMTLTYKLPLYNKGAGRHAAALRASVKVPLGDSGHALGSGNWDASVGALYQRQFGRRFRGYVNADYVFVGQPDWKNVGYQDMLVTLWGLEYALDRNSTAAVHIRTQRNPLRVGSKEADKDSQELVFGFNQRVTERLVWSLGFSEDINPETAPDLGIITNWKWEF